MEEYKDSTRVAAALTTTITTADGFRKGYMYRKDCAVEIDERRKEKRHDGFAADEEIEYEDDEKNSSERSSSLMRDEAERGDAIIVDCEGGTLGEEEDDVSKERRMNLVEECVRDLLAGLGEDVKREGLLDTPKRVAKAMLFAMKGYGKTARDALGTALFQEPTLSRPITMKKDSSGEDDESTQNVEMKQQQQQQQQQQGEGEDASIILVRDVPIFSTSSTSMMPFYGVVHIGYVPKDGYILGLSKVARVAEVFARRMQNPEGLAREIAEAVGEVACASGVGVVLETTQLGPRKDDANLASSRIVSRHGIGCLSVCSSGREKFDHPSSMTNDADEYEDEECCEGRWTEFEGLLGMGRAKMQESSSPSSSLRMSASPSSERGSLKAPPKKALEASVRLLNAIGLKSAIYSSTNTSSENLLSGSGDDDDDDDDDDEEDDDVAMRDNNSALADDTSLSSYTSFEGRARTPPSPSNLSTSILANDSTRSDKKNTKNINKGMPSSDIICRSIDEPFSLARCAFNYASMMSDSVCGRDVSLEYTVQQNLSPTSSSSSVFGRCFSSTKTPEVSELTIERDLVLTTTCEHHLLPFHGVVHVAYWHSPGLALERKLVQAIVSRQGSRLQVQERLTSDLADDLEKVIIGSSANVTTAEAGVMVCISAAHMCMASRGVEKTGSSTCTVATRGKFASSAKARSKVWQSL